MLKLLLNPFERFGGLQALLIGMSAWLINSIVNYYAGVHFDGVVDVHVATVGTIWVALYEGLLALFIFSLLLWAAGIVFSNSKIRFVDVIGCLSVARVPLIIATLFSMLIPASFTSEVIIEAMKSGEGISLTPGDMAMFLVAAFGSIGVIVWVIALMYKAFTVSVNLKGSKAVVLFIAAIIVAEIAIKWILVKSSIFIPDLFIK